MARSRRARPGKPAEEVEVLDQQEGDCGTEIGLIVFTTIFLLAAVIIMQMALSQHYQEGLF